MLHFIWVFSVYKSTHLGLSTTCFQYTKYAIPFSISLCRKTYCFPLASICLSVSLSIAKLFRLYYLLTIRDILTKLFTFVKVRNVAKIRYLYNQVPHLTQDTTWESDKNTIKHHKQTRAKRSTISQQVITRQQ